MRNLESRLSQLEKTSIKLGEDPDVEFQRNLRHALFGKEDFRDLALRQAVAEDAGDDETAAALQAEIDAMIESTKEELREQAANSQ